MTLDSICPLISAFQVGELILARLGKNTFCIITFCAIIAAQVLLDFGRSSGCSRSIFRRPYQSGRVHQPQERSLACSTRKILRLSTRLQHPFSSAGWYKFELTSAQAQERRTLANA
ncbi:hypothetical protein OE88DRAFT_285570 [Heliocybe sulcata]|uniref:Uncharacterized protein n=1 Tax=Heliocybe sulcata TaxID=5364 RepID=A0A5C3MZQ6_9AGAM|nr:hypothetical protein OE88DRAFT_285570 [Heliocybe sulcata]